ncbi:hypothetical protein SJI00_07195 [Pseudomonas sp. RP23018S]|uniref:hypothetical protein n=1 Tax=Pseudomonas sp. RP23018S TaxID=3096037 RepID=UPI002ACA8336|nr:hypothetical protein [Pseudomonas sp. RP23018S]MDZ5602555.1 hypothetical protein [Pseudomonas sp. RP23018S]
MRVEGVSSKSISLEDEVKSVLRGLKITNVEMTDGAVTFSVRGEVVTVTAEEVDGYKRFKESPKQVTETSIFFEGYYEQAVEIHGYGPNSFRLFKESRTIALKHDQSGFIIELSPLSAMFVMHMADNDEVNKDFRRATMYKSIRGSDPGRGLRDLYGRFMSVKVFAPADYAHRKSAKQLQAIADSGLYHISYGNSVALVPLKSWERSFFRISSRSETVQFPLLTYNQELVAYYQMALGAESLVLAYLALYKILEYFYTDASEHILHKKLKAHLVAPDFSHAKVGKLRALTKLVRNFDSKMNERVMLQTVLEQHVDKEALRDWIKNYQVQSGVDLTVEQDVFGKSNRIDLSDNQIFPAVGARIYQIRNALVHNKEGEESRFTPFSGQERLLVQEVPLLLKIAEDLIHRTGKELQL